jgi:hypothetical protein
MFTLFYPNGDANGSKSWLTRDPSIENRVPAKDFHCPIRGHQDLAPLFLQARHPSYAIDAREVRGVVRTAGS